MAIIGLSMPYFGKYNYDESTQTVAYSDGGNVGKAISYGVAVTKSEDIALFANDFIAEMAKGKFQSGLLTLGTSDLSQKLSRTILGAKKITITAGGISAEAIVFDDDTESPYLGFGIIETHQVDGVSFCKAIILTKVNFVIPDDAATTQGETIEWQTKTITANVQRSDIVNSEQNHPWKYQTQFATKLEADAFLRAFFGVVDDVNAAADADDAAAAANDDDDNAEIPEG